MIEQEKLLKMLQEDETVIQYLKLEKLINENKELRQKINDLKALQKKLVNAKEFDSKEQVLKFELKYQKLLNEVELYPLMSQYLSLQADVNEMLQNLGEIIEQGLKKELEK